MSSNYSSNSSLLSEPPARLWQYARKETFQSEPGRERRRDRRYSLITCVRCLPVDGRHQRIGESFVALSSGMSISGIRLIHTAPAPSKFLRLEFEGQPVKFLLSVIRTRPIGDCYEIAGRLCKLRRCDDVETPGTEVPTVSRAPVACDPADRPSEANDELLQWAAVSAAAQALVAEVRSPR